MENIVIKPPLIRGTIRQQGVMDYEIHCEKAHSY
jgi:hypothetical protein